MSAAWDGLPQNPERDGWHWVCNSESECQPTVWDAGLNGWRMHGRYGIYNLSGSTYSYLGPCTAPNVVRDLLAALKELHAAIGSATYYDSTPAVEEAKERARAAIARAEGTP